MNIGTAIKSIRKQLGLSQIELAQQANVTQATLSQLESGNKRPNKETVQKLCDALRVPESLLYILAMEDADVPEERKDIYEMLYPSIRDLALKIVGTDNIKFFKKDAMHIDILRDKLASKISYSEEWINILDHSEPGHYGIEESEVYLEKKDIWVDIPTRKFSFKNAKFDFTVTLGSSSDGASANFSKEAKGEGTFDFIDESQDISIDSLEIEMDLDLFDEDN